VTDGEICLRQLEQQRPEMKISSEEFIRRVPVCVGAQQAVP
jgi:hypothetical protein